MGVPEGDRRLDSKDVSDTSLGLAPKTRDSQVHQHHDVAPLGPKSGRAQYEKGQKGEDDRKGQRGREDGKGKKGGEDGKGERGGGGHWGNKVNPVVGENSGSKASVYHHIIYGC